MGSMPLLLSGSTLPKPPAAAFNPPHKRPLCARLNRIESLGLSSAHGLAWDRNGDLCVGNERKEKKKVSRGRSVFCAAAPVFSPQTLRWVSTVASIILMFSKGTAVQKSFLAPYFALQAPSTLVSWIKGDYGKWSAFLALLVRLFCPIPGEVELPFNAMLLTIVSPSQTTNVRGAPASAIASLVIAGYLGYQHLWTIGSLEGAFDQGRIIPSLALISTVVIPCLLLLMF